MTLRCRGYLVEGKDRFKIGMKFIRSTGRRKDVETIEDIYTTTNSKGKIVRVVYVTSYLSGGQKVFDYEVPAATIARAKKA